MKTIINKKTKETITVINSNIIEGSDYYYIKKDNISLPKTDWKLTNKK